MNLLCIESGMVIFQRNLTYVLFGLLAISCKVSDESSPSFSEPVLQHDEHEVPPPVTEINRSNFILYHTIDQVELTGFKHFGDFFDDRLRFYYTDNPGLRIGKAHVQFLMLYFIDNRLVKIRYHLNNDISNYLIDSLGMCKIKSSDSTNMAILKSGPVLYRNKNRVRLNPDLDDYEMIWDRYVVESRYITDPDLHSQYDFDSTRSRYVYIDQLKSFKRRIYELERAMKIINKAPS